MGKVSDMALQAVEPVISQMGFEVVDVEYISEHKDWYLNIYIDKPGGVGINDCEQVSGVIDPILDEVDPTAGEAYILCVSSPGLDRPIKTEKDYNRVMGQKVDVKLYKPVNGNKQYTGIVCAYEQGEVELDCPEGKMRLSVSDIALARLHIEF